MSLKNLRQKYPEYNDIPDLELAEKFYKKEYSDLDESVYYELMFPKIAAKRGTDEVIFPDDEFNENLEFKSEKSDFKPVTSEIARSAGVSVNDPADIKSRFGGSLGYNQEQKELAIKNSLSKIHKQDIDVRTGPETGELEYFNPKTQSYALVDKPGMDFGDLGDIGGDAMVIVPDLAATVVGTIFTTPVGGVAAGAIAAAGGEYARLKLGQTRYGINQDLTDKQLLGEAFKTGGISLGAGFIGLGGAKLMKGVNNLVNGRTFGSVDEGLETIASAKAKEADEIVSNINKQLEDAGVKARLKYTMAEAADNKDLLAIQASFENSAKGGRMGQFREFGQKQANALNEYFRLIKKDFGNSTGSTYDTGLVIKEILENRNKDTVKNIIKKQKASEELLEKKLFNLPDGSSKVTGVEFRSVIGDLKQAYKSKVKLAATELDKASGVKMINTDEIAKIISRLSDKEKKIFVKIAEVEGVFKKDMFENLANPNGVISLSGARETMSVLSKLIREKQIGLAAGESVDVGRLQILKNGLTTQVKKNAGKEYLDELQRFNDLVITNKELLNNDIIAKLTKIEIGSILRVADEDIFETTFKKGLGSGKAAREVHEVISRSPDALNAYKNSIFNKYKKEVLDPITNKPNITKHNAFLKTYEKPLKVFFNKTDYSKISRIGGLQRNIEKTNKLFTNTQKELNKSFEGTLLNTSPEEIFKKIYKPNNIGQIRTLNKILAKNPEVLKKFQRDVLTDLNESVFKIDKKFSLDRVLDANAFNKYLNGGGGEAGRRASLKELFGNEYVKNLDTLNKALQVSSRSAPAIDTGVVGSAFKDIVRARVGQFTLAGRVFTAFGRLTTGASNRLIARALLNPDSLKDLIKLRKMKRGSKEAAIIFSKLGVSDFLVQDDRPTSPPKEAVIDQEIENLDMSEEMFEDITNPSGTVIGSRKIIQGDQSFLPDLPQQNLPETPSVDVAALQPSNTTMNQDYNSLSSLEKDKLLRGIS